MHLTPLEFLREISDLYEIPDLSLLLLPVLEFEAPDLENTQPQLHLWFSCITRRSPFIIKNINIYYQNLSLIFYDTPLVTIPAPDPKISGTKIINSLDPNRLANPVRTEIQPSSSISQLPLQNCEDNPTLGHLGTLSRE